MAYLFEIVSLPARPVLTVAATCRHHEIGETLMRLLPRALEQAVLSDTPISGPPFARYLCWRDEDCDLEGGLPVERAVTTTGDVTSGEIGGYMAAKTVHTGAYSALSDAHRAAIGWIEQHGYKVAGSPWESYIDDPADVPDTACLRTEVYWPIAE